MALLSYIITIILSNYYVLHWFWLVLVVVDTTMFLFVKVFFVCPYMAINVSIEHHDGLLPDII